MVNYDAIQGIFGDMSIACWVVVFTPQIIQNFRQKNADALSLHFILIWLIGDIFNIIGSILQGVLGSMIVLAAYYTIADLALLCQMFFYRGFTFRDAPLPPKHSEEDEESSGHEGLGSIPSEIELVPESHNDQLASDGSHQPPHSRNSSVTLDGASHHSPSKLSALTSPSRYRTIIINTLIVLAVGTAGYVGWVISEKIAGDKGEEEGEGGDDHEFDVTGQVFGYLCAATYIASRIPQLLLNWRRKATDGLSMLFFTFTFLGNTTYIISILAYDPKCEQDICRPGEASDLYKKYFLINLSWLLGSFINLTQDVGVFAQYFRYRNRKSN